ncbi:hypothetical protein [Microtetraspora niveoalba]|uniref:hypothetical protein n=1 Tax=Microtetraspora niveoalba TaxID=46175 RepID=UPI000B2F611E|nr:hypothetical protein [Microtetraspora niveoalba]
MTSPTSASDSPASQDPAGNPRALALCSAGTAIASLIAGTLQVVHTPSGEETVVGIEHLMLVCLAALMLLQIPIVLALGRSAGSRWGALVAAAGMMLLTVVTTVSNVRGRDASFFAAIAIPANLLWFAGLVAVAVHTYRRRCLPLALAVLLPLTWVFTLPLSSLGGGLLAAAYWGVLGWMLWTRSLPLAGSAAPIVPGQKASA